VRLVFGRLVFVLINRFAKTFSHNDVIGEYSVLVSSKK